MKEKEQKNMIVVAVKNNFGFTDELIQMIEEHIETVFVADLSEKIVEKQGRWNVVQSGGKTTVITEILPLYTVDTFKVLMQHGLTHEYEGKGFLLNHMIQYEKTLPWDLLDYLLEDGLQKEQYYDVNAMLSLVKNVENAKWLLAKGAKCSYVPGYGQTFLHIAIAAKVSKNTEVLDLVIREKKVDYDWLTCMDKDGFLNIDSLIMQYDLINGVGLLGSLLQDEMIVAAKKEWSKTAKRSCVEKLEKFQKRLMNLIIPDEEKEEKNTKVIIKKTERKPKETHWSYPFSEIPYLLEQIEDGDREDGEEFLLYGERLYEQKETTTMS